MPLLENSSGLSAGKDFGVCMNPEFLREKSPLDDFLHPDRIVVGELEKKSGDIVEKVYSSFNSPITRTSARFSRNDKVCLKPILGDENFVL